MQDLVLRVRKLTAALNPRQLITLGLAFVAAVVLVVGASYYLNAPDYRVLFADMDPEEASRVEAGLKTEKVLYQLTNGGRDIEVPKEEVDRLRLHFSSAGMPTSGRVGYELFDRTAFGQTEFLEQVNYRRALEGEIARTIATISDVRSARVHIAMAKSSLFESREQPAKASVILTLKRNHPLAASTVAGIVNLVAFSVEGLRPEAVVLIDSTGRPLARPSDDSDEPLSAAVMERQGKMERELASEVVRMIEPVVGAERVRANVTLRLNTRTQEETLESYDPATVIRSRQVTLEGAAANAAGGLAGARGNLPGAAQPAPPATPVTPPPPPTASLTAGNTGRQAETVNYEVGKKTTHSLLPRGDVARLSVAVVVDNARQSKTDAEGKVTRSSTPRPQAEMQKIQQLVAAAVGLDTTRGDQLIVENVSFDEPIEEPVQLPTLMDRVGGGALTWARPAIVLVVGLIALLFVLRPIVKGVFSYAPPPPPPAPSTRTETQPLPRQLPRTIEEVEQEIEAELDAKVADHISNRRTPILQKRVAKAIETEPENAARLIRAWLSQEEA
ncbi:MAG: flagellar basal-body MS-ring/collar protein FliF [Vicinamibacteraceae bacterium]